MKEKWKPLNISGHHIQTKKLIKNKILSINDINVIEHGKKSEE